MESLVADTIAAERFYTLVLGIFAAVAVLLSAAGIYGVLSYWVNQRTSEIGVRMALGATRADVLRNVVGHGMALTGFGVAAGLAGAVASTRVLANSLFEVGARDPGTFAGVAVLLIGIALLACWVPAQRASRVDPVTSLREE
jgi:putative ABC transport system permease protein